MNDLIVRYVHSSVITFLGVFIPILGFEFSRYLEEGGSVELTGATAVSLLAVILRAVVKAAYELVFPKTKQ